MTNTFSQLQESLKNQVSDILQKQLHQHIHFKLLLTKDVCYVGKVFKIIATNNSTDDPNIDKVPFNSIDFRYSKEQMTIVIPLQMHDTVEELSDYINTQIQLAVRAINEQFK